MQVYDYFLYDEDEYGRGAEDIACLYWLDSVLKCENNGDHG